MQQHNCTIYCPPNCPFVPQYCIPECEDGQNCVETLVSDCIMYEGTYLEQYGVEPGTSLTGVIIHLANLVYPDCSTTTTSTSTSTTTTTTASPGCMCYTVEWLSGSHIITYDSCETGQTVTTPLNSTVPIVTVCAVINSLSVTGVAPGGEIDITTGASCLTDGDCTTTTTTTTIPCLCYTVTATEFCSAVWINCDGTSGSHNDFGKEPTITICAQENSLEITGLAPLCTSDIVINGPCSELVDCETTTTTTLPPPVAQRCIYNNVPGAGFEIDKDMQDIEAWGSAYIYELQDFTINGTQYATGQTLTVSTIGEIVLGLGLDGNTYLMNISDWMTTIGAPLGFVFHDNMRVIDTPDVSTIYTIKIRRLGPGGGPGNYYYSSQYGFSPFSATSSYGSYSCSNL